MNKVKDLLTESTPNITNNLKDTIKTVLDKSGILSKESSDNIQALLDKTGVDEFVENTISTFGKALITNGLKNITLAGNPGNFLNTTLMETIADKNLVSQIKESFDKDIIGNLSESTIINTLKQHSGKFGNDILEYLKQFISAQVFDT